MAESTHARPFCKICNTRLADKAWTCKDGKVNYRSTCSVCRKQTAPAFLAVKGTPLEHFKSFRKKALLHFKEHVCQYCGFEPLHLCQIHVDHINGNHGDSRIENLQLLCANCHALKTWTNGDVRKGSVVFQQRASKKRDFLTNPDNFVKKD